MPSDFRNLEKSGASCVGCGRGPGEGVILKKLPVYSLALACWTCFVQYASCEQENVLGIRCHHLPQDHYKVRGPCSVAGCGCQNYIHGLSSDHDRMYAEAVGKAPQSRKCHGIGARNCDNIVFVGKNGEFEPLCSVCKRSWIQGYEEARQEAAKFMKIDTEGQDKQ